MRGISSIAKAAIPAAAGERGRSNLRATTPIRLFSRQAPWSKDRPAMKLAIIKERRAHERRVAASPDTVKHMVGMGIEPVVESGAGAEGCFADGAYSAAGATM